MGIFKELTDYIPALHGGEYGQWVIDREGKGTLQSPIQMPYVSYRSIVRRFQHDVYGFMENHPEYALNEYQKILEANSIQWETNSMETADVSALDGRCIMALLVGVLRADRFCEGILLRFFESGTIEKCLLRLKEIDN